jgi:hypothetical protein
VVCYWQFVGIGTASNRVAGIAHSLNTNRTLSMPEIVPLSTYFHRKGRGKYETTDPTPDRAADRGAPYAPAALRAAHGYFCAP